MRKWFHSSSFIISPNPQTSSTEKKKPRLHAKPHSVLKLYELVLALGVLWSPLTKQATLILFLFLWRAVTETRLTWLDWAEVTSWQWWAIHRVAVVEPSMGGCSGCTCAFSSPSSAPASQMDRADEAANDPILCLPKRTVGKLRNPRFLADSGERRQSGHTKAGVRLRNAISSLSFISGRQKQCLLQIQSG